MKGFSDALYTLSIHVRLQGLPILYLSIGGSLAVGIWLAVLGQWKALVIGIILLLGGAQLLALLMIPSLLLASPARRAFEVGNNTIGFVWAGSSVLYTTALVVGWAFIVLKLFCSIASDCSRIPTLLWSYGAAIQPWVFMAKRDQQSQAEGNLHSIGQAFFLSASLLVCIADLLIFKASLTTCFWILAGVMGTSAAISFALVIDKELSLGRLTRPPTSSPPPSSQ